MNEQLVGEKSIKAEAENMTKQILDRPISDQNELFTLIRKMLTDSRSCTISEMKSNNESFQQEIKYAEESLKTVIMGELK
ncbi:MAG TPA: hypothetical protein VMV77_04665 [Bacteroidales bacterium]|nr:hypothetical protein [Bacteroidales bacterium]